DPERVRRRTRGSARGDPAQRRRRDRRFRSRRGSRRGAGTRADRRGFGRRCGAARPAGRVFARARGARLMGRFRDSLAQPGLTAIAEVKRRSPSAGDLRPDADPAELAAAFELAGAAAVSILVDERFAGTVDDLRAARSAATLPLLAKGFFSEEAQLDELK